jgi:hypothetical protein
LRNLLKSSSEPMDGMGPILPQIVLGWFPSKIVSVRWPRQLFKMAGASDYVYMECKEINAMTIIFFS